MFSRKIGAILRGKVTPVQITLACVLGAALGFMPGFAQAPGLYILLVLLVIVLNANLFLFALVVVAARLLSIVLMPIAFHLGRTLIDGPTAPLAESIINAPVLALCGFEYYAVTGGLVLALIGGGALGWMINRNTRSLHRKLASLEEGSELYSKLMNNSLTRLILFVLIGGGAKGKKSFTELVERGGGNPIRPIGVVFALVVAALIVVVFLFAKGPIVTMALQQGLERANGATVDIQSADVDLKEGRLTVTGLAMADPNALDTDLFRAETLEADLSNLSLLQKRVKLDRVAVSDAAHGAKRQTPGYHVGPRPEPDDDPTDEGDTTLDDYLETARTWKQRLEQLNRWLEKLSGPEDPDAAETDAAESLEAWLRQQIADKGYGHVAAQHRIQGAPTLHIVDLLVDKLTTAQLPDETLRITASHLSTHPALIDEPASINVTSSGDTLAMTLSMGELSAARTENAVAFTYRGLDADTIGSQLKTAGSTQPLQGGTIDVQTEGTWSALGGIVVDLPLNITLHDTTLALPSLQPQPVSELRVPIGVHGPLARPRIDFDKQAFAQALAAAGLNQLAQQYGGELLQQGTDKIKEQVGEQIGDQIGEQAGGIIGGLLGGNKDE
jgi:uncharacterized protein (TIGR03546 family)